jgi:VIT1/CCC1 family predicted Fe2+/Mn2+ transporter
MSEVSHVKHSIKTGFSFGLTSGIITTLGLMVGLHSGTHSKVAVLGGILTIAIADAMSDALGIHVSEEAENQHTHLQIWASTFSTFFSKLVFALTFVIPVVFLELGTAILVSIAWGLLTLAVFSYTMARRQDSQAWKVVLEHVGIAVVVIAATHSLGDWIRTAFG